MNEGGKTPDFSRIKLYIGLPTRGQCSMNFARSLASTCSILTKLGIETVVHESRISCFPDMNRNTLVAEFMQTDCTHMLMIDDDMEWQPAVLIKMLTYDVEFISAVGPKKTEAEEYACLIKVNPDNTPVVENGLIKANSVGGAFVILKREAIERMIDKYPELRCMAVHKETGYNFYETRYTVNTLHTEDYIFCERFQEAGGDIWIYPDMDFTHTGVKDYKGNFHNFLTSNKTEAVKQDDYKTKIHYSIIIVAYKSLETLTACLESFYKNPPLAISEIIVIDNSPEPVGIDPELWERLKTKYFCKYRKHDNIGFAEGCNIGARMAEGRYFVFANPDTIVYEGWAQRLQGKFIQDPKVGAVGPVSNFVCGLQNIAAFSHTQKYTKEGFEDWAVAAESISQSGINQGIETKMLIGFFLMVSRQAWENTGEFDKGFFLGCDDLDYSLRLRDHGYKLMVSPNVFIYHEGHASFKEEEKAIGFNKESEKHLITKLKDKYGEHLPSSTELWGCEIFPTEDYVESTPEPYFSEASRTD